MMADRKHSYRLEAVCPCGSGQVPMAVYDARGIFVFFACNACSARKRKGYRPEIFTDPNYWHDEPLDPEP